MVCALGATGAVLVSSPALGAVIKPSTFTDENGGGADCSLREAVLAANTDAAVGGCPAGGGADTIALAGGTYTLSIPVGAPGDDGDLDVAGPLAIRHDGVTPAVIDAGGIDRVIQVLATGTLTASGFTLRNGRTAQAGAGIRNEGTLNLSDATVAANTSTGSFGGGISDAGVATMSLTNVTVSGNRSESDGGGIDQGVGGVSNLKNLTVADNLTDISGDTGGGGGIFNAGGTVNLTNTLIARNRDNTSAPIEKSPDCGGVALTSHRNNLIGDMSGCHFVAASGDLTNVNPLLGPLANNGGSTLTYALLARSPAINAGGGSAAPADQRGVPRKAPDIGGYEFARCGGKVVNRVGTSGKDKLAGTKKADGILGMGGKDLLQGRAGKDGLCGGRGRDRLKGGGGRDTLVGGKGKDVCKGGPGRDVLRSC
jgi:CSLREA domain-containing protein